MAYDSTAVPGAACNTNVGTYNRNTPISWAKFVHNISILPILIAKFPFNAGIGKRNVFFRRKLVCHKFWDSEFIPQAVK